MPKIYDYVKIRFMNTRLNLLIIGLAICLTSFAQSDEAIRQFDEYQKKIAKNAGLDHMPRFPQGTRALFDFLNENIHYPEEAEKKKIEGRVIITFVVDGDSTINEVEIIQRVHPLLDAEALRVVKAMPKWEPATKSGVPVRVKYTIPISFVLPQDELKY